MSMIKYAGALLVLAVAQLASAQNYPTKPVRLVVGGGTGGVADISSRIVAPKLGDGWGQQVVVEHRPAAGGIVAAEIVAKAAADGYTLLMCSIATHAIGPAVNKKLPYDPAKAFAPIARVGMVPNVLSVNPSVPAKSVKELIAYAKANPGKLQHGSTGAGNSPHLTLALFSGAAGIKIGHVSLPPDRLAIDELVSGRISMAFGGMAGQLPMIKAGKVRALAVTSAKRNTQLPDVPTLIESGLAGLEVVTWAGICTPTGVAKPIIAKINADVVKVLGMQDVRKSFAERGIDVASSTPDEFAAFIKAESARWAKAAKSAGIEPK